MSQITFSYGPQLGFAFSHFPTVDERRNMTDFIIIETNPLISPLVGFYGQLTNKKHLQFTTGLQYQMTGTKYHQHVDGRNPRDESISPLYYFTLDEWENQTFHKLCLPLTVGYTFTLGKVVRPSVFVGFRPNLFLIGNYTNKLVIDATDNSKDYENERQYDPVNIKEPLMHLNRLKIQYLLGISALIGQHFRIALTYNFGQDIIYEQYPSSGCINPMTSMTGEDFGLNVTYFLKSMTKKTVSKEKKE